MYASLYPSEPQDRCVLHRRAWCDQCWELNDEEDEQ